MLAPASNVDSTELNSMSVSAVVTKLPVAAAVMPVSWTVPVRDVEDAVVDRTAGAHLGRPVAGALGERAGVVEDGRLVVAVPSQQFELRLPSKAALNVPLFWIDVSRLGVPEHASGR